MCLYPVKIALDMDSNGSEKKFKMDIKATDDVVMVGTINAISHAA